MKYENIWLLDDRREERRDSFVQEIEEVFRGSKIRTFQNAWDTINSLRRVKPENIPQIIFFDAYAFMDETKGFSEFEEVIDWLKKNRPDRLPEYVVFISADYSYAAQCKRKAIRSGIFPQENIYAVCKDEIFPTTYLMKKKTISWRHSEEGQGEFRTLLNRALNLNLPVTREQVDDFLAENGLLDSQEIVAFYNRGKLSAVQAMQALVNRERFPFSASSWEYIDDKVARDEKLGFQKGAGEPTQGYATFSIEDAVAFRRQGKKPVLIVERFDPASYVHLSQLSGLIVMSSEASGHLELLAGSYGVSTLIVPKTGKDLVEDYRFFKLDQPEQPFVRLITSDNQPRLEFIYGLVEDDGYNLRYRQNLDDERHAASVEINPDDLWKRAVRIESGDPVTMNPGSMRMGLHKGHIETSSYGHLYYINDIKTIFRRAAEEHGWPVMAYKANIDTVSQVSKACEFADGIGLIRTEHLAFTDATSFQALRDIYLATPDSGSAHAVLKERQQIQTTEIFDAIQENWPYAPQEKPYSVRVRLLDAPPEEFLSADEMQILAETIPTEDQRGAQMGIKKPDLYRKQLDAIFTAYKEWQEKPVPKGELDYIYDYKLPIEDDEPDTDFVEDRPYETVEDDTDRKAKIKLEIMVPTIRTVEELLAIKQMAHNAAKDHGFDTNDYKFGIMLETPEAATNIRALAQQVNFISIGSNDLTSTIMGISRSDIETRKKFIDPETGKGDPFVTLHNSVAKIIRRAVRQIRAANEDVEVDLCGAHAADLSSLKALRPAQLTSVSMPPSGRNHHALVADWLLYNFSEWQKPPKNRARAGKLAVPTA